MWVVGVLALAGRGYAQSETLAGAKASQIRMENGTLLVGHETGGVSAYDPETQRRVWKVGESGAKVLDVRVVGNRVAWIDERIHGLSIANPQSGYCRKVGIPDQLMSGMPKRLTVWKNWFVVHSDTAFVFVEPETGIVKSPQQFLPPEMAEIAGQGLVDTYWNGQGGMFVSIRRYGQRSTPQIEGETREIALINAWSVGSGGQYRLLGGYAASVVDFKPAFGPEVRIDIGTKRIRLPFGTGPTGNIRVSDIGLVALGNDRVHMVPFYQNNWVPNTVEPGLWPRYSQVMDFHQESVWWAQNGQMCRADLTDGSSQVYFGPEHGQVRALAADEDGVWLATDSGVRRFEPGQTEGYRTVGFEADGGEERSLEQQRIAQQIQNARTAKVASADEMVRGLYAKAKINFPARLTQEVDSLDYGDLVYEKDRPAVYVGSGKVLALDGGMAGVRPMRLDQFTKAYRIFDHTPIPQPPIRYAPKTTTAPPTRPVDSRKPAYLPPTPSLELAPYGEIRPIGVNRPKSSLGTNLYVRAVPGASFDKPYKDSHKRLLDVAKSWIGTPYRWGGNTRDGIDCSGFVCAVYKELGVRLPRHSQDIGRFRQGKVVTGDLHFGDVLVYQDPKHVAIYVGNGRTIESVKGGVGYSNVARRSQAVVRRFL